MTLQLEPGAWELVTSGGVGATTGTPPVASPHGNVKGGVTVSLGTPPPVTTLRPPALVLVNLRVQSVHGGDVPGLPPTPMNNATIVLTRIDVPNPPEPVTVFPATSVDTNGGYSAAVTPGQYRVDATASGYAPFSTVVQPVAGDRRPTSTSR